MPTVAVSKPVSKLKQTPDLNADSAHSWRHGTLPDILQPRGINMARLTARELADLVRNLPPDDRADFAEQLSPRSQQPPKGMPMEGIEIDMGGTISKAFDLVNRLMDNADEEPEQALEAASVVIGHVMNS